MKCRVGSAVARLTATMCGLAMAVAVFGLGTGAAGVELRTLSNGMKVALSEEQGSGLVGLVLLVGVEEGKGPLEARQVWANAFGAGVEGRGAVEEAIAAGSRLGVEVGWRHIILSLTVPKEMAWECLRIWGDRLAEGAFSDEVVEEAKKRTTAALRRRENDSYWMGQQYLEATYNGGLGLAALEERERAVEAMDADVLSAFQRQYVVPGRLVLGVVGDIDTAEAVGVVEQAFGGTKGENPGHLDEAQAPAFPWGIGPVVAAEGRQGRLAYVSVGYSLEGASEEEWVSVEMLALLMRSEIGDLGLLRQQGGAGGATRGLLGVGVSPEGGGGMLVVYGVSHPLRVEQAVEAIEAWVAEWASKEIADVGLNRAKDGLLCVTAMRWQSVRLEGAYWAAWAMAAGTGETPERGLPGGIRERQALIGKATAESVRAVASKFLRARHLAILMPVASGE